MDRYIYIYIYIYQCVSFFCESVHTGVCKIFFLCKSACILQFFLFFFIFFYFFLFFLFFFIFFYFFLFFFIFFGLACRKKFFLCECGCIYVVCVQFWVCLCAM